MHRVGVPAASVTRSVAADGIAAGDARPAPGRRPPALADAGRPADRAASSRSSARRSAGSAPSGPARGAHSSGSCPRRWPDCAAHPAGTRWAQRVSLVLAPQWCPENSSTRSALVSATYSSRRSSVSRSWRELRGMGRQRVGEVLLGAVGGQRQLRQFVAIAANVRWQLRGVAQPGAAPGDREHPVGEVRHRDDLPFQALGRVHREHLHPAGRGQHLAGGQTVLAFGGGIEIVQQFRAGPAPVAATSATTSANASRCARPAGEPSWTSMSSPVARSRSAIRSGSGWPIRPRSRRSCAANRVSRR